MGQWVLQCSIKVQGFLLGTIFGADVPLKFQASWGTKADVSDCENVWTSDMAWHGSFWKTCWNLGDVDLCLAFRVSRPNAEYDDMGRFCQLGMHLPTSAHLQGMLLLFFVIVFPSSLYLSALQILGLNGARFVTLWMECDGLKGKGPFSILQSWDLRESRRVESAERVDFLNFFEVSKNRWSGSVIMSRLRVLRLVMPT